MCGVHVLEVEVDVDVVEVEVDVVEDGVKLWGI